MGTNQPLASPDNWIHTSNMTLTTEVTHQSQLYEGIATHRVFVT